MRKAFYSCLVVLICSLSLAACSDEAEDLVDAAELALDPPSRQQIDRSYVGVNSFFNLPQFGTTSEQYTEAQSTLRLNFARVLFAWTNDVQPSPGASPNYSFYDEIVDSVPGGFDILVVVAHTPDWMTDPANWIDGDPIKTWVERWLKPTVARYAGRRVIIGWQVFNEPDHILVPSDVSLGITDPVKYFDLLQRSSQAIRATDPAGLVVLGATRSIQQDSGNNLDYNKALRDLGAEQQVDIWAIHYYGEQFEKVTSSDGVANFLNGLTKPVWITESGEMGLNSQLSFAETVWPFLIEEIPSIQRIYYFRFNDTAPADITFGLRTAEGVSDLYIRLRDGA